MHRKEETEKEDELISTTVSFQLVLVTTNLLSL